MAAALHSRDNVGSPDISSFCSFASWTGNTLSTTGHCSIPQTRKPLASQLWVRTMSCFQRFMTRSVVQTLFSMCLDTWTCTLKLDSPNVGHDASPKLSLEMLPNPSRRGCRFPTQSSTTLEATPQIYGPLHEDRSGSVVTLCWRRIPRLHLRHRSWRKQMRLYFHLYIWI